MKLFLSGRCVGLGVIRLISLGVLCWGNLIPRGARGLEAVERGEGEEGDWSWRYDTGCGLGMVVWLIENSKTKTLIIDY